MKSLLATLGFFALALSPLACGKKDAGFAGSATVSGKVVWDKNPLPFGSVQFYGPEMFHTALIESDGSYRLEHLPEGPVTVCVRLRGDLYADSRSDEGFRKMLEDMEKSGKGKVPEGLTIDEMREKMRAIAMEGKPGKGPNPTQGQIPAMPKNPKEAKMLAHMPLVKGMPLAQAQKYPPEALQMLGTVHDKYGEFGKTPLTYTVLSGPQTHDIILK